MVIFVIFTFGGNYHFVTGEGATFPVPIKRASYGFSEMFICIDAITGMPVFAAMLKYPLCVKALEREGYVKLPEIFSKK